MFRFIVLTTLFVAAFGSTIRESRIIGGEVAPITQVPYQVSIQTDDNGKINHICGGVILSSRTILTAVRCAKNPSYQIRAGSAKYGSGGQVSTINKTLIHENNQGSNDYDFALVFLNEPLTLDGKNVAAARLPVQDQVFQANTEALVSGWGVSSATSNTFETSLRSTEIQIIDQDVCAALYAATSPVTKNMICAGVIGFGGQGFCEGDIGGPLVVDNTVVGISSWAYGCGLADYPGVYARIAAVRTWIDKNILKETYEY